MDNESNQSQNNTGLLVKIMNNVLGLILISLSHTSLSRSSNFSDYSEGLALADFILMLVGILLILAAFRMKP
ncbi:MAG: hypothetical protein H8E43_11465 [Planctomycetia bacterium]|nr:hypothetical protein [Planctomycetia bacterium]MBL6915910.1 hypothetical protein [Planctomycetota bacterium]